MTALSGVIGALMAGRTTHEEIDKYLSSLPKAERHQAIKAIAEKAVEDDKHRKAVELAEAGRPRNFWGK